MGLDLDDRQRAMLREMGVQVWLPRSAPGPVEPVEAAAGVNTALPETAAPAPSPVPPRRPAGPPIVAAAPATMPAGDVPAAGLRGDWQALFAPQEEDPEAPVWLVLADSASPDLKAGDAGRLLDAMLRAAGLHRTARVWGASVGRQGDGGVPLAEALEHAVAAHRPAMVLLMGRLAAQSALGRGDPLGRLRGGVHGKHGASLVATYEPAWLLRAQDDKARAWEDLCRALAAAGVPAP